MSKLEELYKARQSFPDLLSPEQWKEKEDALLQEELASAVSQSVAQVLSGVSCPVTITINYEPQGDIVVKVSRKESDNSKNFMLSQQATSFASELHEVVDSVEKPTFCRSESIGFRVYFPDGTVVERKNAKDTMIGALKVIGLHRAAAFRGRLFKGLPLVSRNRRTDVDFKCQEYVEGWYVYVNMSNDTKIEMLRQISDELNLGLVIKDEQGNDVTYPSDKNKVGKKPGKRILYKLNGEGPYSKRELVLLAVTQYQMEHPNFTYAQMEQAFPKNLQGSYGVVRPLSWIKGRTQMGTDHINRYYSEPKDLLTSADGIKFAVCNQWGDNFANFIQQARNLGMEISEE